MDFPHSRRFLGAVVLAVLATPTMAQDFIFSTGNYVPGVTAPEPLLAGDTLQINTGGNKIFSGVTFNNQSQVDWNADSVFLQSAAVINNGGLWDAHGDFVLVYNGGVLPTFANTGILRKSGGAGALTIGAIRFVNSGTLDAQSGVIDFNGGNATFDAGSVFTGAGSSTITSNAAFNGTFTSANLRLVGGTFTGTSAVINGHVDFTGGTVTGGWGIANGQSLRALDGGNKILSNADFTNLGTLNWDTANSLFLQSATVLDNQGTIAVNESMSFVNNGGVLSRLVNDGTLRVAAGKTATMGAIEFVNNGLIDVLGELRLNGNNAAFNAGSQFTGSGVVAVNSNATFNGSITASPTLSFRAGTFTGANDFVIGGNPEWTGGTVTGQWTIAAGQLMTARDGGNKILGNADFTNLGTLNWDTANSLFLQSATVLDNQGTIAVNESMSFVNNGGVLSRLVNDGTLRVAAGKTATMGAIEFVNSGLIDVQGVLNFSGNNATFNDGTEFTGTGVSNVGANARFVGSIESQNLRLSAGTQVGGDGTAGSKAILHGSTEFTGGAVTGHWDIAAGATLDARAGGNKILLTATLTNKGALNWETSDTWFLQSNADVLNQGTIAFETDNAIAYNGGAIGSFRNEGLIVKRGGSGTTSIGNNLGFVNAAGGIIDVQTGTLALPSNFGNDGTLMGTGTFASNAITNNGRVAPGASIGTLGISGAFTQSATGTLDIELENLTSFDLLTVSGITTLDGTLALHCFGSCVFDTDDEITILDSTGNLLGEFAAVSYFGFGMGEFEVIYDRINHDVILRALGPTSPVPLPAPFWLLVGGMALLNWRGRRSQRPMRRGAI